MVLPTLAIMTSIHPLLLMVTMGDVETTVALSTVEVEYVAMSRYAQQMVWMQNWLDEVEIKCICLGIIKGDSHGAISLTKNTKDHGKVKHIDI